MSSEGKSNVWACLLIAVKIEWWEGFEVSINSKEIGLQLYARWIFISLDFVFPLTQSSKIYCNRSSCFTITPGHFNSKVSFFVVFFKENQFHTGKEKFCVEHGSIQILFKCKSLKCFLLKEECKQSHIKGGATYKQWVTHKVLKGLSEKVKWVHVLLRGSSASEYWLLVSGQP